MQREEGEEGRVARGLTSPQKVTKEMREEHERTHTPFRSWCEVCVKARGINMSHKKVREDEELDKVPRVAMDYFFMSQEDEKASKNPLVAMVDEETNEKFAGHWKEKELEKKANATGRSKSARTN